MHAIMLVEATREEIANQVFKHESSRAQRQSRVAHDTTYSKIVVFKQFPKSLNAARGLDEISKFAPLALRSTLAPTRSRRLAAHLFIDRFEVNSA